jgi:hypothetical protein
MARLAPFAVPVRAMTVVQLVLVVVPDFFSLFMSSCSVALLLHILPSSPAPPPNPRTDKWACSGHVASSRGGARARSAFALALALSHR